MPPATKSTAPQGPWTPPASFDQFLVERPLGHGGMGRVYLGKDVALDRPVALKFISSVDPSPAARSRFLVEARAIAKLNHPNVVGVYRVGEIDDQPYIAYEFVAGQSLDKLIKPLSWETALRLAVGLARGLDAAHRAGILHRDIKPGNAVLSERGEVKLLDFGLAKLSAVDDAPAADGTSGVKMIDHDGSTERFRVPPAVSARAQTLGERSLTRPGMLMGTPAYLASELWLGEPASPRSDVFALGLVLFELLLGRLPHAELSTEEMAMAVIDGRIPSLAKARPDIPETFAAIVDRCLRKDAAERFPSATELCKALEEVQTVFLPSSGAVSAVQVEPERLAVAKSLSRMSSQLRTLTTRMYDRLFTENPGVRPLFPDNLEAQQDKLAHALKLAIDGLADPERLAPVLEDLGRRHVHYSVTTAHFQALERAIIGAIAETDAEAWEPELERAWRRAYAFIESAMRKGMAAENETVASAAAIVRPAPKRPAPVEVPRTRYAHSGELSIAYQVIGEGPVDIVFMLGWLSHVEITWQHPAFASFLRELARHGRVIIFDKRGTGMSDRAFDSSTVEDRVDDLEAVLDHAGSKEAVLFGVSEGASTAAMFAAMHPSRVRGLVLYGGTARMLEAPDYTHGLPPAFLDQVIGQIRAHWGEPVFAEMEAPSMKDDRVFGDWLALFMRMAASPGTAISMLRLNAKLDLRNVLPLVQAPTLVLHRKGDRVAPFGGGQYLAEHIAGARFVALEGDDHLPFTGDTKVLLDEVERFVTGAAEPPKDPKPLVAVLSLIAEDAPKAFLEAFLKACDDRAKGYRGVRVDDDSVSRAFSFDGGIRAVRAARDILDLGKREGVSVRIGLDAGPCAVGHGAKCSCNRVAIAAGLAKATGTGTARVSQILYSLSLGSELTLEPSDGGFLLGPSRER